jgi:hypothetical protein
MKGMVRVVVVPLDDEEALRKKVRDAINWWFDGESDYQTCLERSTDDVLNALGLAPKRRRKIK